MIPALNLGCSSMPGGLTQNHVPHGDEADEPREECLDCGERECVCGEDEYEPDEIQAWLDQQEDQQHNF